MRDDINEFIEVQQWTNVRVVGVGMHAIHMSEKKAGGSTAAGITSLRFWFGLFDSL